jgi:hypothetical protein
MQLKQLKGLFGAAVLLATTQFFPGAAFSDAKISAEDARQIASEGYLYFYPLLSMDVTRRVATNFPDGKVEGLGPANEFHNFAAFPTADFKTVVRPNFDTLYSSAWVDLTQGPVVMTVPDTGGRYYLMPILDMWSNALAVPGKRTSGTGAGNFDIVPQGWTGKLPEGVSAIEATTPHLWIIGRTQTNGVDDYDAVHKVQAGYKLTLLSDWGKEPAKVEAKFDDTVDMKTAPKTQVDSMSAADYFKYAADLLKVNPPQVTDWSQLARLARIGIVPGQPWDMSKLDADEQKAIEDGVADAQKDMAENVGSIAPIVNGWQMNVSTMGVYGDFYFKRALVAQFGLGANQPEDAIYPLNLADADGKPVMGENTYVMHFDKADLPPVDAFWSLTMYDAEGFQVANAINRFAIGDRDKLKFNADGSLDLYIQHADPGGDKTANWLPAPASGKLGLTLRLYAPKTAALDGRWVPPVVKKQ